MRAIIRRIEPLECTAYNIRYIARLQQVEADLAAGLAPQEEITRIKTVAIRGAEMVRELMIYAGQEQQGGGEPVDLSRLTAEMLELMKVSVSKHAILKIDLGKSLPLIWGNASQMRQVLMNLVINASEAIGEAQGVIQVKTLLVPGDQDAALNHVQKASEGECVRLEVSDSGCGMTEETKAKIFDPFFTTKFAGRGLGLAVVQGIVRAHGGCIDVVSTPGHGTMFRVELPAASKDKLGTLESITPSKVGRGAPTAPSATVLVVEDEEVLRLAVSKALRMRGFAVIEAKDGSIAMDLMRQHRDGIDVILLDVTLPGTSSREVFEEARRIRTNLKIVLSSAYDRGSVDAYFAGLRVTQFIRKPFQLHDLEVTLRDALAG